MNPAWPASFHDYVDFVQETRGEEFPDASRVRFADRAALIADFQSRLLAFYDANPSFTRSSQYYDDVYRALGVTDQEFNLIDERLAVVDDIAAFYDFVADELVIPSEGGRTLDEIPLRDRPVIVHELGHALQSSERFAWSARLFGTELRQILLEGEAQWLRDRYVLTLSDDDYQLWLDSFEDPATTTQPEILEAEFFTRYDLGSRFFHARYATAGLTGIDAVFDGPASAVSAQLVLDPWRFTGAPAAQEPLAGHNFNTPDAVVVGEVVSLGVEFLMSAVEWHQVLGAAVPGDIALRAARGINSYMLPVVWLSEDDGVCFGIEASASTGDEEIVELALRTWSQVDEQQRWFQVTERGFSVGGCDPGPGNVPAPRLSPLDVLSEAALVIDAEIWAVEHGLAPESGFCVGWDLAAQYVAAPAEDRYDLYQTWFDALQPHDLHLEC